MKRASPKLFSIVRCGEEKRRKQESERKKNLGGVFALSADDFDKAPQQSAMIHGGFASTLWGRGISGVLRRRTNEPRGRRPTLSLSTFRSG